MTRPWTFLLAVLLVGCGEPATSKHEPLPRSDPYIGALYSMMNLGGCRNERRSNPSAAEIERTEGLIAAAQADFESVKELARSKGLSEYLQRGRTSFGHLVAEELIATCQPHVDGASIEARAAIGRFRDHVLSVPDLTTGAVVRTPASIRYDAGPCYGSCPVFAVTVFPNGRALFVGREHTVALGERRFDVPPATYRTFAEALAPLKPSFGSVPKGRPCNMTDGPSYTVTWVGEGGEKQSLCWGDHGQVDDLVAVRARMNQAVRLLPIDGYVGENMPPAG